METFSQRHGLQPQDAEIVVRHEAPDWLRDLVVNLAYQEARLKPSALRSYLCSLLLTCPDRGNWSEYPNIDEEVRRMIDEMEWYYVYDLIEWVFQNRIAQSSGDYGFMAENVAARFQSSINDAFRRKGVGWQMLEGKLQVRGPEVFEQTVQQAMQLTQASGREVARQELHEALRDLSRRPQPEITGAIQHSMAALECIAKNVTGHSLTLGDWVKKNPEAFPPPLNNAVEKLWGYTSQYGRHVQEGKPAEFDEAELVVGLAGALSVYLLRKAQGDAGDVR